MKKYLYIIVLILTSILLVSCNNTKNNNKNNNINNNNKEMSYEKRVNELTMQGMIKFFDIDINEEIDNNYVLNWDAYNKKFDSKIAAFYNEYGPKSMYYSIQDIQFPENLKIKQLISQKIRKYYSKNILEDDILYQVALLKTYGISPTNKERNTPGFVEEDWYAEKAISSLLLLVSETSIRSAYNTIKPHAEIIAYFEQNPDALDNEKFSKFKNTALYYDTKSFLDESKEYINGNLGEEGMDIKSMYMNNLEESEDGNK